MRLKNDNAASHLEELSVYADLEQPMWLTRPQTLSHDCIVSLGYFRSSLFCPFSKQKRLDCVWIHHFPSVLAWIAVSNQQRALVLCLWPPHMLSPYRDP
jgi:hypothetical protein